MSTSAESDPTFTAFADLRRVAAGPREAIVAHLRERAHDAPAVLVFDDATGEQVDFDLRADDRPAAPGTPGDEPAARGVGRPRLGVVAREVTLLPRHWDWLARQPGGASVALRKLVDEARHVNAQLDAQRASREATYRFMTAIAGDLPAFEEAARALFAGERQRFESLIDGWAQDVRTHVNRLASAAWSEA